MPLTPELQIQYGLFGFLFVAGTCAYVFVANKLKDPRKIYSTQNEKQDMGTREIRGK
jgi:hypothetical protein